MHEVINHHPKTPTLHCQSNPVSRRCSVYSYLISNLQHWHLRIWRTAWATHLALMPNVSRRTSEGPDLGTPVTANFFSSNLSPGFWATTEATASPRPPGGNDGEDQGQQNWGWRRDKRDHFLTRYPANLYLLSPWLKVWIPNLRGNGLRRW